MKKYYVLIYNLMTLMFNGGYKVFVWDRCHPAGSRGESAGVDHRSMGFRLRFPMNHVIAIDDVTKQSESV